MKTKHLLLALVLVAALLAGCSSRARVGTLRSESQSVELGDAKSVDVEINFGAGDLKVTGGAKKLLEADFTYNVDKLKPEVKYTDGTLVLSQPENEGLPDLRGIADFRNEWGLRLKDEVPMDLRLEMGAGSSDLQLAGLSLTGLDITLGAGKSTIDLSSDWVRDVDIAINTGAADVTVRLPGDVGVRVEVEAGPHTIDAPDLTQDGNVYTNDAYGNSNVTLHVNVKAGIGRVNLELVDHQ
jgi:hypothetical protein